MKKISRRKFIGSGLIFNLANLFPVSILGATKYVATPSEIEGPFYPLVAQQDKDFDLTKIEGRSGTALGQVINIKGRIIDTQGKPVSGVIIDLWQANAAGRYRHKKDLNNYIPLDPNFQGWAIIQSDDKGEFRIKTIFPGSYPAGKNLIRTPHIHLKITKKKYKPLTTQMYFENNDLNDSDFLLKKKSAKEKKLMMATKSSSNKNVYHYDIVLTKV
ncbi:MAG: protocatechuate 3,4-dioxygenase [Thiohalomonadales bacterium]